MGAYAIDDGSVWAAELMSGKNSKILVRSINWAIGEPDRKLEEGINVKDTRVGEPAILTVKSKQQPKSPDHTFYKTDEDIYQTTVVPEKIGFQEVLSATFASNYPLEYQNLGMNQELRNFVSSTGGLMFESNDVNGIYEYSKTRSKRVVTSKETLRWPFLLAAMILFLIEIFIRRYFRSE